MKFIQMRISFLCILSVAMESTTILGAILGIVALMLVFLLYVNRRWCFHTTPAFSCCDENSLPSKYVHKMGMLCALLYRGTMYYIFLDIIMM